MFSAIRSKIIEVINEQATTIKEAHRTDRSKFDGYPAAIVTPSEVEADYHQTRPASNQEVYVFTIRIHYPFTEGQDKADIALEKSVDELLTIFRDRTILGDAADWVEPTPAAWGYQDRPDGTTRVAELKIRARKIIES